MNNFIVPIDFSETSKNAARYAAHARGGEKHVRRLFGREESLDVGLTAQIELGARPVDEVLETLGDESSPDRRTDQTPVTCDEDSIAAVHSYAPRADGTWPAWRRVFSWRASSRSWSTIIRTRSRKLTRDSQPSACLALLASPQRWSTSDGRK